MGSDCISSCSLLIFLPWENRNWAMIIYFILRTSLKTGQTRACVHTSGNSPMFKLLFMVNVILGAIT